MNGPIEVRRKPLILATISHPQFGLAPCFSCLNFCMKFSSTHLKHKFWSLSSSPSTLSCFAFTVSLIATNPLLTCCVLTLKYPQHLFPPLTLSSLPDCHPTEDCDNKSAVNGKDIGEQAQSVSLC